MKAASQFADGDVAMFQVELLRALRDGVGCVEPLVVILVIENECIANAKLEGESPVAIH